MAGKPPAGTLHSGWSATIFTWFAGFALLCLFVAVASGYYALALLPAVPLVVWQTVTDFRPLFLLLLACIPLATEVALPGGLALDLPTEPLMVGLMLVFALYLLRHWPEYPAYLFRHPLTVLLLLHLGWIYLTTVTSDLFLVSLKFSLAKTWYIVVCYLLAAHLLRRPDQIRQAFWWILLPLLFTVVIVLFRHARLGFSFADQYRTLAPFYRNHVNYAALLALFFPWVVVAHHWYRHQGLRRWFLRGALLLILVAIYFSFTRAAYIALLIALGTYLLIRWRLLRVALAGAVLAAVIGLGWLLDHNRYLDYAPNYERTVSHDEFGNLVEATYKLEDISTMERLYRWVAGGNMFPERPWLGWGPGNFVNFYEGYTIDNFQTYVSNNPERSGIHSYFLMTLVEQGVIGFLLFIALVVYAFLYGERSYHRTADPERRRIIVAALASLTVIISFLLINDMIETVKMGTFFFLNLAILVNMGAPDQHSR
jgi:O-antigen ligase